MRSSLLWLGAAVVAVLVGASVPLLFDSGYYFVDDTQAGALGQWWKIGERILSGDWSFVNPTVWQSGNYLAEGAWGLFSPVLWLVGLGSHVLPNAVVYVTIVKFVFFAIAAAGVWGLAREFGASPAFASLTAVAGTLGGFTLYIDAPSWVNGFMAWAFWPAAWWLVRRAVFRSASVIPAILVSVCLIGIGYVHATLMLAITLLATIVEATVRSGRNAAIRAWAVSVAAGCFAVIVHIPGLLISPVSGRRFDVFNSGLLTADLSDLLSAPIAIGVPSITFFSNPFPDAPLFYMSWLLPLAAFISWRSFAERLAMQPSLPLVALVATVALLLPSDVGPLRFPVRLLPYVTVLFILILAIGLSTSRARITRTRVVAALAVLAGAALIALFAQPSAWKGIGLSVAIAGAGYVLVARILRQGHEADLGADSRSARRAAVIAGVVTLVFIVPQHVAAPRSPLPDYRTPHLVADLRAPLADATGDTIVVGGLPGDPEEREEYWAETLVGNLFYMSEASVQNAYSSVYYPAYQNMTCMAYNGVICPDGYRALFTEQETTGEDLATLLGVSSIQIIKSAVPRADWARVPDGWRVVEDTSLTRLITRDEPIPGAGGVVWSSEGTEVTEISRDASTVRFRVDRVADDGGRVALSRILWPGYSVSEGAFTEPTEGLLMTVDVPPDAAGSTIEISYRAPGWPLQWAAAVLLVLILAGWSAMSWRHRRAERRTADTDVEAVGSDV